MQPYPPLGTLYAAAVLREAGYTVGVFDCMLAEPIEGLRRALQAHSPKIVAIYEDDFNFLTKMCLTRMRELAWQIIEEAKRFGAHVVVHGSDATDHASEYLSQGSSCVLLGESEESLLQTVREFSAGRSPADVPGAATLRRGAHPTEIKIAPRRTTRPNVALPFPARDLIDMAAYDAAWRSAHGFYSTNLVASRGCPFLCNWCAKPIFGDAFQVRSAESVVAEMSILRNEYGAQHLWFADDIFGLSRRWLSEFANEVVKRKCSVPFKIQARADLLDQKTTRALKRAGCAEVWMGVESGSQRILDAMDKGLRVEQAVLARVNLKSEGIRACYFLQFGYPGETWEDLKQTIALVRETQPDDIGVSFSYPLPNTKFHDRVQQQLGTKRNWSESDDLCVMFKGAYKDDFYRDVRNALHTEVDGWKKALSPEAQIHNTEAWRRIELREPHSKNPDATQLWELAEHKQAHGDMNHQTFVSLANVAAPRT
jgi:radical SAM superfamily enzyme YgiQ (UPF0313 family)